MVGEFDLDSNTRRRLGYYLMDRIDEYFTSLNDRAVQTPYEDRRFVYSPTPLPELGQDPDTVLAETFEHLDKHGFHIPSAHYLGLMNPTPTYVSVLAEAMVAALNPQLASVERSAAASIIEAQTVNWMGQRVGWKTDFGGYFTTGGSEANTGALNLALAKAAPGVLEQGLRSLSKSPVFYGSSESHHSLDKAAVAMGLGRNALRRIRVNECMQMDPLELEAEIVADLSRGKLPFCIVATAGTTNTGAIDDLAALAEIAKRYGLWLHADGAYGAAVLLSDKHRRVLDGIDLADSVSIDPHKWLAMPFAAGILLTTSPALLRRVFGTAAPYLRPSSYPTIEDNYQTSSQWSRRMNSLKLWMTLRVHGRRGYERMIDRQVDMAGNMSRWIEQSQEFTLVAPQSLTAVAFQLNVPGMNVEELKEANKAVVDLVNHNGQRWLSMTTVAGRSAIRMMVISYLTEERHLRELQAALRGAAKQVRASFAVDAHSEVHELVGSY